MVVRHNRTVPVVLDVARITGINPAESHSLSIFISNLELASTDSNDLGYI